MTDIETINRRGGSPGRRDADSHTCVFHQDFKDQQAESKTQTLNCLIAIKDRIKILESKMGSTINVKIAGIITSVAMGFVILFVGAAFNMMRDLRSDLKSENNSISYLENRTDKISDELTRQGTIQGSVLKIIAEMNENQKDIKKDITEIKLGIDKGG